VFSITDIAQFWGIICAPVGFLQPVPGSPKTFMRTRILFTLWIVVVLCFSFPKQSCSQTSARTLARSLDQLIEESDVIVHGSVMSSKIEPHPQLRNLMTVVVTMNVKETYKGKAGKTLVFRQYVWNTNGGKSSEYRTGQDLILLLRPTSQYGLSSPAGLEQGRFLVLPDNSRRLTAVNGRANIGLFDHLEQNARAQGLSLSAHLATVARNHQRGPLLLTDLEEAIRTFARSR
jgi:hypothetical protein